MENGTWTGIVGDLISGEIDISVATLTMTTEREEVTILLWMEGEGGGGWGAMNGTHLCAKRVHTTFAM
jgi:hypothetical protein